MPDNGVSIDLLKVWLKVLEDEIFRMRVDQHIFQVVFRIIEKNPDLSKRESHLYGWMYDNYLERMAMGVRRLRDTRRGTISLTTFLRRLSGDPSVVSRKYYFAHFEEDYPRIPAATKAEKEMLRKHFIGGEYDRLVGQGWQQPTADQLESEIAWLEMFGASVVEYATLRIAHHDETPPSNFPSLDDVDMFIDYAEELLRKYIVLVKGVSTYFDANFQYDWLAPLRITWLPDELWLKGLK